MHLNLNFNLELRLERITVQKEYHCTWIIFTTGNCITVPISVNLFFKGKINENITVCVTVHVSTLNAQVRPPYIDF